MTRDDRRPAGGWVVSPAFDLLFLANVGWVALLIAGLAAPDGVTQVQFWQVYFLTTPHRWITLGLVALDPDRRAGRGRVFVALAALAVLAVVGVRWGTGTFLCLALIDFVWNGWHFASQHQGVLRIYSRKAGSDWPGFERYGLRAFVVYVILRSAGWATSWADDDPHGLLRQLDLAVLAIPLLLVARELAHGRELRVAKTAYLGSVCGAYSALLLAVRADAPNLVLALTAGTSIFHAVEYLAIVTHYAWRRGEHGSPGLFRRMAGLWLGLLAAYVVVLGVSAAYLDRAAREWWVGANLVVAFLHYAYDGMIWKLRQPATAQALGAEAGPGVMERG